MPSAPSSDVKFEIGHVLFIDIVGYSKLRIDEQKERIHTLNEIVLAAQQVRESTNEQVVRLPTGDGMALVFRNSSEEPVRCALEVAEAVQKNAGSTENPRLRLRMGVHSGPVSEVIDVSGRTNIAGAGINMAQRVMDCGDAGHILLSKHVADDLEHYPRWQPYLHSLGECEVKHGARIAISNLYRDGVGNSELPTKFRVLRKRRAQMRWTIAVTAVFLVAATIAAFIIVPRWMARSGSTIPEKSIAVLPFENLSDDKSNAYFADGIQDEILTKLASIADLKVISRTSTRQYQSKPGNLIEIAKQLGVATILEGSAQKAGAKIRVNVQLIKAATDGHLWANTYDRELIDVLKVESDVATEIASALKAALTPNEKERLTARSTNSPRAYDLYLQARQLARGENNSRSAFEEEGKLFEQAVALDPGFAAAHAGVASVYMLLYSAFEPREDYKTKALTEAKLAVQLDPNSGPAHGILAVCLNRIEKSYEAAAREYEIALQLAPNDANLIRSHGLMRRQQGHWREGLASLQKAAELDPQNTLVLGWLSATYLDLRRYQESVPIEERCVALGEKIGPEPSAEARFKHGFAYFEGTGDFSLLDKAMAETPGEVDRGGLITQFRYDAYMLEHRFDEAEHVITASPQLMFQNPWVGAPVPKSFLQGRAVMAKGESARAQGLFEAALPYLQKEVTDHPEGASRHAQLGILLAYLGRKPEALKEAQTATGLLPESKDAYYGVDIANLCAIIFGRLGDAGRALPVIEHLLRTPHGLIFQDLRFSPDWDPLRNDARFQKILASPEPKAIYN